MQASIEHIGSDLFCRSPHTQPSEPRLDYEAEEAAILQATRRLPLHLVVEESGTAELRGPLNDLVNVFAGDVLAYLADRGKADQSGRIPEILLDRLVAAHANKQARRGEPLLVLTHSMGGQLIYDALTHFGTTRSAPSICWPGSPDSRTSG